MRQTALYYEQKLFMVILRLVVCKEKPYLPVSSVNGIEILSSGPTVVFIYKIDLKISMQTVDLRQAALGPVLVH